MNPKNTQPPISDHAGHRDRLKTRIQQHGATKLADYELLEALLFYAIPRRDTKEISKTLINKYKFINNILNANYDELKAIPHIRGTQHYPVSTYSGLCRAIRGRKDY